MLEQLSENTLKLVVPASSEAMPEVHAEEYVSDDPLRDLMEEFVELEVLEPLKAESFVSPVASVNEEMSEDQAWLALKKQMRSVNESVNRLRYFLSEIDDSIRR